MKRGVFAVTALAALAFPSCCKLAAQATPVPAHEKSFWQAVAANQYEIPPGEKPFALARELSAYLGSPDPQLRDDLAYTILAIWIVNRQQFAPEELWQFGEEWTANLRSGIGERETDSVFKRSFSALSLSSLAERDRKTPFLGEVRYRGLLEAASAYLAGE
jgi:hypothetical protein